MKKLRGISFLIVMITLAFGVSIFAEQRPKQDPAATMRHVDRLIDVMEQAGAKAEHIRLSHGATHKTYEKIDDARTFAEQLAYQIGLEEVSSLAEGDPTPPNATVFHFENEDQTTALRVIATPNGDRWDAYVTARLFGRSDDRERLGKQLEAVYRALERQNIAPQFSACTDGLINDKLTNDVQTKRLHEMLALLGAEVVEKAEDPTVNSISAYTPEFSFYIRTNGEKMNTQAASRVDDLRGQTRITVGTPIITIEY